MPIITYNDKEYYARDGELLLDCLLRHGVTLPVSEACDDGRCQRCTLRELATTGQTREGGDLLACATTVWNSVAVADVRDAVPAAAEESVAARL